MDKETQHTAEKDVPCGPGCFLYTCPASGETECLYHGGFDRCCDLIGCPANGKTRVIPTRDLPPAKGDAR